MATHNDLGIKGEELAKEYLVKKGFKILETNWRYLKSEIDIIAIDNNDLIFIEVKTRSSKAFQLPQESVTIKKQQMLIKGANEFVQNTTLTYLNIRFDIVTVLLNKEGVKIEHIKDAFYPF